MTSAPMNPLRSLASDADAIARYTTANEGPVVLVGHSSGGAVISQAAPAVKDVIAQDNAIPPDCQRFMVRRMNASVESVSEGSHAAFIAHPEIAASLILRAIERTCGPI